MGTNRLEAFSDGVLAIVITIMVLELEPPERATLDALWDTTGTSFLAYVLSFVFLGIYWNNHHHVFQLVDRVSGPVLWANLHLLFWMSLFPFTTAWMSASDLDRTPTVTYAVNLLLAAIAYWILELAVTRLPGEGQRYREAVGSRRKEQLSIALYVLSISAALWRPWIAVTLFVAVAVLWLVPDRRIERYLSTDADDRTSRT